MNWKELLALHHWVLLAGLLHFCQIPAMLMAPRMLGWKEDLPKLSLINRRIVVVIALAIVLVVVGMGIVVACAADQLVDKSRLATGVTGFLAVFWAYRAAVQWALYFRIWVKGWLGVMSNYGLGLLLVFLTVVYLVAFIANLSG